MNTLIKNKIEKAKEILDLDPNAPIIGEMVNSTISTESLKKYSQWSEYCEFLQLVNGARCGSIDLWSLDELESNQYMVEHLANDCSSWICVGQILYEPLLLQKGTNQLLLFLSENDKNGEKLGTFDTFLEKVVFGTEYKKYVEDGELDEWWGLINKL